MQMSRQRRQMSRYANEDGYVPGGQVAVDEAQRLEVLHAGGDLIGHVHHPAHTVPKSNQFRVIATWIGRAKLWSANRNRETQSE